MQWLPPLLPKSSGWRLALAERSAAVLARILLDDDCPPAADALADALRHDPPLAIWVACRAERDGAEPRDVESLAAWFAGRALDELDWSSDSEGDRPNEAFENGPAESFADRVEAAVARAELAATLADEPTAEEAYLAGLLHEPLAWAELGGADGSDSSAVLPSWFNPNHSNASVTRAVELLSAGSTDSDLQARVAKARDAGRAAGRRWTASDAATTVPLAQLVARLRRLATLETQFQETLEVEKLEAIAEFAAGAGHEINNPLAVIAGRAQLFLREETDPERRRALVLMNTQAKRVYEMIADMMLFARPPEPSFERVELVALVDQIVAELQPRMNEQAVLLRR
ncbi:MAG: HAMP domain-containing histidine kinase, partial [Pirellulales bacterium]|nr:HAMP domain-containing histidine kinase [Pirellulales bacterium]